MSRKPRSAGERQPRGVRERILDAAMRILHDEGLRGLSQVQVARAAKVRQSHLTYYFPKRYDLLEAVSVRFVDGIVQSIDEIAAGAAPGDTETLLRRIADAVTERGHMRMFTGVIVEADSDPEIRACMIRETERVVSSLAKLLGGDTERAALALASLWGLGLYDFVFQAPAHRAAVMQSLMTFLGGVRSLQ